MKIKPTIFVQKLKPYRTVSHKVWEYTYDKKTDIVESILKLDWNEASMIENNLLKDLLRYFVHHHIKLNWYPDTNNVILLKEISRYVNLPVENIQYFGGSDAALEYICRTFIAPRDKVIILGPTYDNFRVYAESCGGRCIVYLNKDPFVKDVNRLYRFINLRNPKAVYIVNPNNPTGVLYEIHEIEFLLKKFHKTLFIIDEAYYEFCGLTCSELVKRYENIIITRSFTKAFALGGFRLGYILAPRYIIEFIDKIRVGKNINTFAQVAGILALRNKWYMEEYVREVKESREILTSELRSMGLNVISTCANFILIKVKNPIRFTKLLEENLIFVRDRSSDPQLSGYVRITVGDLKTTKEFLNRFKKIIKKHGSSIF